MKPYAILLGTLLLASGTAFACKPRFDSVADYANGRIIDHAVFVGTVKSVEEHRESWGTTQRIRMEVTRWLSGKQPGAVVDVRGATGTYGGTDCAGQFDFSAKAGQRWLIFGQNYKGAVNPDPHLSRLAPGGDVPASVLHEFKRPGSGAGGTE